MNRARSIFISGAAHGIGRATAVLFHHRGWRVAAADIDAAGLADLTQQLGTERLYRYTLDVSDISQWRSVLADFANHCEGKLDLLFNNAGILYSGPFTEISAEQHQRLFAINVQGVSNGCHAAFEYLNRASAACVVNMSSASAICGQPHLVSYSASKFAVHGLSEALSLEWQPHHIRVIALAPLFVGTGMVDGLRSNALDRMGVRLQAADIAEVVWRCAHYRGSRVHWRIGWQTKLAYSLSKLSPAWLNRWVNGWLNRS